MHSRLWVYAYPNAPQRERGALEAVSARAWASVDAAPNDLARFRAIDDARVTLEAVRAVGGGGLYALLRVRTFLFGLGEGA